MGLAASRVTRDTGIRKCTDKPGVYETKQLNANGIYNARHGLQFPLLKLSLSMSSVSVHCKGLVHCKGSPSPMLGCKV
jgi:hypothetical protein